MKKGYENYHQINSFFDAYRLPQAATRLSSCIKAADSNKIWKGRKGSCPSDLLLFMEKFEGLLEATFRLAEYGNFNKQAILDNITDSTCLLSNYDSYCANGTHPDSWDFFPRHLNLDEFLNPYEALQKVLRFQTEEEWQVSLNDILHYALSPFDFYEFVGRPSLLRIYLLLHKLLEACHLIEVRTVKNKK